MRIRRLPVLLTAAALTAGGLTLSGPVAEAKIDCTPVIDTSSIDFTPATVAIPSTGYKTIQFSAAFTAPCGKDNGSDLDAAVIFSSSDIDGSSLLEARDGIYASTGDHSYGVFELDHILSGDLQNSFAGTWTTEVDVSDTDDDPVHSYDIEDGPSIRVLRAATVTANATPEPAKSGKKITVRGSLTRANWDTGSDTAYGKRAVALQFRTKTGSYATLKTVHSSSKGAVKATVTAGKDGYYRFVFAGSSTTAAATSKADFVDVK